MLYQNQILIEGHLTKKPELKKTKTGKNYSHFGLCYNSPKKLSEPNDKGFMYEYVPNFFNLTAWNKNALIANEMDKGQPVTVTGKLMYNSYTNSKGLKINNVFILVESIKKLEKNFYKKNVAKEEPIILSDVDNYMSEEEIPF